MVRYTEAVGKYAEANGIMADDEMSSSRWLNMLKLMAKHFSA
jgi:hypothetical protein